MPETTVAEDIEHDLRGFFDDATRAKLFKEILALEKQAGVLFTCRHCKKQQTGQVSVPDAKAVVAALDMLMNRAWGRPGAQPDKPAAPDPGRSMEELSDLELEQIIRSS
jgi:hypothetical protein